MMTLPPSYRQASGGRGWPVARSTTYNNQYRSPSKEFKDFMAFQRREVAALAKEMVDITHELGKEAMMFLGDH